MRKHFSIMLYFLFHCPKSFHLGLKMKYCYAVLWQKSQGNELLDDSSSIVRKTKSSFSDGSFSLLVQFKIQKTMLSMRIELLWISIRIVSGRFCSERNESLNCSWWFRHDHNKKCWSLLLLIAWISYLHWSSSTPFEIDVQIYNNYDLDSYIHL